jgi:ribosomal protein L11 methyltransferase
VSRPSSPALAIHLPADFHAASRDRLVALLADHDLLAIQEDDVSAPRVWVAHFGSDDARRAAVQAITSAGTAGLRVETTDVEDEDWARRTQADLPAIRVGRVTIAPPWDIPAGELVVEIEPSRGFGTGHHQSTRLCLVLLQTRNLDGQTVIDVGTGSGVLAIVAARLGAAFVSAIDADPEAVENARENIERNRVSPRVEAHVGDITDVSLAPADVVTANLTGTLLARHARALGALVKPSGSLIAAGFTVDEKQLVLDAFAPAFAPAESAEEDDWWAFVLARGISTADS